MWNAYNIGSECLTPYSGLGVTSQGDMGLRVMKPFGQASHRGSMGESVRHQSEIYSCQETGCILAFKTQAEADNHMDMSKHRLEVDCESMHDRVRRKWAGIVTGVMFSPDVPSTSSPGEDSGSAVRGYDPRPLGWALKVPKRPARMTDNVKTSLMKKFEESARTGNKADPVQVAREMKTLRNENSEPTFKPEE